MRCFVLLSVLAMASAAFVPKFVDPTSITPYRNVTHGTAVGTLYAVVADGYTDGPMILADLSGPDHYSVGYLYGALLAQESEENYYSLLASLVGGSAIVEDVLGLFLDWQYESYLSKGLNQDFLDEMRGVTDGGMAAGHPNLGTLVKRGATLSSIATGDVKFDILTLLKDEFTKHGAAARAAFAASPLPADKLIDLVVASIKPMGKTCSMWGAWGARTADGSLFSGRNLDWEADTGVSKHKTLTLFRIAGRQPYVSVAFASVTGAITGMSKAGITVHEAGDDNTEETLLGFAWSLRLRMIMENATTIAEAKALWEGTNNTLGLNHGVGSGADAKMMVLETKAGYTAYFEDNDPREANFEVDGEHYGFPMVNATWRTNHGYDPTFLKTVPNVKPDGDSETRYMLIHDTILQYETTNTPMTDLEALNVTAVAGDKGGSDRASFVQCGAESVHGANIISATFHPAKQVMYVAFEDGHGAQHVPACCNNYVRLDMSKWW